MRRALLILVFALVAGACGGADDASTPTAVPTTASSGTTAGGEGTTAPDAFEEPEVLAGAEPASDFSLALGDGGEFSLSDEQKPVYMVFWAEW